MMAQKDFETDSKTFWSLLLSSFPKRISSLVSRAQNPLGDDDPERRKRKRRRRRAFLYRRRPHRESAQRFDVVSLFLCVRSRLEFLFQNTTIFSIERRPIKARAAKTTTKADAKTTLRDERTNERNEEQQQQQKCPRKRNSSGPG